MVQAAQLQHFALRSIPFSHAERLCNVETESLLRALLLLPHDISELCI